LAQGIGIKVHRPLTVTRGQCLKSDQHLPKPQGKKSTFQSSKSETGIRDDCLSHRREDKTLSINCSQELMAPIEESTETHLVINYFYIIEIIKELTPWSQVQLPLGGERRRGRTRIKNSNGR